MPVSELSAIERIARVLAAQRLSINADGYEPSVAVEVDDEWRDYLDDAIAVLKTLREPDIVMANAGNAETWTTMVEAAIDDYGFEKRPGHVTSYPPRQTRLMNEENPLVDLTSAPNDADDQSDAGLPTTDHEAAGWRATSPSKP